jgi:hypothetical protein
MSRILVPKSVLRQILCTILGHPPHHLQCPLLRTTPDDPPLQAVRAVTHAYILEGWVGEPEDVGLAMAC